MTIPIQFYNSLTKKLEPFAPIEPPLVTMYNCGPTVYDFAHIGNFRAFIFADVLRRFLELTGHTVKQVMNITDVGHMTEDDLADGGGMDKMEAAAARIKEAKKQGAAHVAAIDNPEDPYQIASFYADAFIEDAKKLGIKVAFEYDKDPAKTQMPRATDHVTTGMIPMIQKLIEKDHAYVGGDGAVYYSVQSFPDYGKLSGNTLDKLRGGAGGRLSDANQSAKKHPADFLLWKPDPRHIMKWPSPWGEGYPGWHIECSAMARALLGRDMIDIHTGGEDNIFPHHECEIAQTRGCTDQSHFAKMWMHTRFLLVEGEKMSKSKGNFFTLRDVLEGKVTGRPVDPAVLRFELLKSHYRSNANFTKQGLLDSASAVGRLREEGAKLRSAMTALDEVSSPKPRSDWPQVSLDDPVVAEFVGALANDLSISAALSVMFSSFESLRADPVHGLAVLRRFNDVLGIGGDQTFDVTTSVRLGSHEQARVESQLASAPNAAAKHMCEQIDTARASKDFTTADRLRKELQDAGYEVLNTPQGTVAKRKLA
ncbi:MAG: cysteine--tRNA ligase [Phycisphaeraceae bacterium]